MNESNLLYFGIPALAALIALLLLFFSLRADRRQRMLRDIPTSKTAGVFIGLVELKGTAESEKPLVSHLAGEECVHYSWNIDEHWSRTVTETYTDNDGKIKTRTKTESGWQTVQSGGDQKPFYLKDESGVVLIQPNKAKIESVAIFNKYCFVSDPLYYEKGPAMAVANSDHQRRFVEYAIPLHAPLYVVGHAREREDIVAPQIAFEKNAEMFLISTRSEEQVTRGFNRWFWSLGVLGLMIFVAGFLVRDAAMERDPIEFLPSYIMAGSSFILAWIVGWAFMVFNSLVSIRNRVKQGWSNVDVQLQRRNDLIPQLVNVVKGMRDFEKNVQVEIADLRKRMQDDINRSEAVSLSVCAIIESYPELSSNAHFISLQKELSDTEQRIALARGYFNEIASFYNARIQRIPDRLIAAVGRMGRQNLIETPGFTRAPVNVKLVQ